MKLKRNYLFQILFTYLYYCLDKNYDLTYGRSKECKFITL